MAKRESLFQASLIRTLHNLFEGCLVLKLDAKYLQGIPDLIILYGPFWAMLECKKSENEPHQPNQDYYVEKGRSMAFASFIYPENVQQVLEDLRTYFYSMSEILYTDPQQIMQESLNEGKFICDMIQKHNYEVAVA